MKQLLSINAALAALKMIGGRSVATAIDKRPVPGAVRVGRMGIEGDEQADLSVHGGLAKAVYAYPVEHHRFWQTVRAQAGVADWDAPLVYGSLGENLSIAGLTEDGVCVGDVLRFADCELAVSEPRMPCYKFDAAMGFAHASKLMVQSGWCGYYLSVRTPGTLQPGEFFELIEGPREVGITELFRARAHRRMG